MNKPGEAAGNVQRAAAFFNQPVWTRLLEAIYHKYIMQGGVHGRVVLRACTPEEQREIARFLHRQLSDRPDIVVQLADFQRALNASGFACELPDLLQVLFPARSQITRLTQRQRQAQAQQTFYEALAALADDLPSDARGRHWLLTGQHGKEALFRRYKNESFEIQNQTLRSVRLVIDALQQLPVPLNFERLALFAQRVSGDPHCFDTSTLAGRLFLQALMDLSKLNLVEPRAGNHTEPGEGSHIPSPEQEQQHLLLYAEAGLLLDTISSTVAVFHLSSAEDMTGLCDPLLELAGERILVLPLRQLLAWHKLYPATDHVYLFENPQVFEVVVDTLTSDLKEKSGKPHGTLPTLICTSGWPSAATMQLLNKISNTSPDVTFHYSGDFDLQGLRIAAHLLSRYPRHCQLWRFDPPSYVAALHMRAANLNAGDVAYLHILPDVFTPLIGVIQEKGKKAYQEGIASLLIEDIQHSLI